MYSNVEMPSTGEICEFILLVFNQSDCEKIPITIHIHIWYYATVPLGKTSRHVEILDVELSGVHDYENNIRKR